MCAGWAGEQTYRRAGGQAGGRLMQDAMREWTLQCEYQRSESGCFSVFVPHEAISRIRYTISSPRRSCYGMALRAIPWIVRGNGGVQCEVSWMNGHLDASTDDGQNRVAFLLSFRMRPLAAFGKRFHHPVDHAMQCHCVRTHELCSLCRGNGGRGWPPRQGRCERVFSAAGKEPVRH